MSDARLDEQVTRVLAELEIGQPHEIKRLGGTAAQTAVAVGEFGTVVVRWRTAEFSRPDWVRFDHACLERLASAGLPVPAPWDSSVGRAWSWDNGRIVELLQWQASEEFRQADRQAIADLGRTLGRFHTVLKDDIPSGKDTFAREDHPDLLQPYVDDLRIRCQNDQERMQVSRVSEQLEIVREQLDAGLYAAMPQAVIHGDIHPGNLRFQAGCVSALYDFDYLSRQARVRDLCDALMFFAADRDEPLDCDNIWSLTQAFQLEPNAGLELVRAYHEFSPLEDLDWQGLPLLLRSQWCQIRLRGSRKVPLDKRVEFVTRDFDRIIRWLDVEGSSWFSTLRDQCEGDHG